MRFYRWITWPALKVRTRLNARLDAVREIPHKQGDPTFLRYLAARLDRQSCHLLNRWERMDESLRAACLEAHLRHRFAREALAEAERDLAEARQRYEDWRAEPTRRACRQALLARARALRKVQRAWERREQARVRRESRWAQVRGLLSVCQADYLQLVALYRTVNMRHRDTNELPPSLMPPSLPDTTAPAPLRELNWSWLEVAVAKEEE